MKRYPAVVDDITPLAPGILGLRIARTDGRQFPPFTPGQYATISVPGYAHLKGERSFSIASSAADRSTIGFGIRIGGKYTSALRFIRPGDAIRVAMPFGQFTFEPLRDQAAIFIAGGIGITPFMSMIRTACDLGLQNELRLIYSIRSLRDAAYVEELETLRQQHPTLRVTYVVSDKRVPAGKQYIPGYVTADVLSEAIGMNPWNHSYFLCGPPTFMAAVSQSLRRLGLPQDFIRTERFAVASSAIIEPGSVLPKWAFAGWGIATAAFLGFFAHLEKEKRDQLLSAANAPTTSFTTPASVNAPAPTNTDPVIPTSPTVDTPVSAPVTPTPSPSVVQPTPVVQQVPTYTPPPQPAPVYIPMPRTRAS